jgi:hypothetical protein
MTPTTTEVTRPVDSLTTDRSYPDALVDDLAASMVLEGLRHPILLMPAGQILDGERRVAAARKLGWTSIHARTVHTIEDAVAALIDQRDETVRDRPIEEWVSVGLTIETLDWRDPPSGIIRDPKRDTTLIVGPAVTTSGSQYKRARAVVNAARSAHRPAHVVAAAQQALVLADQGRISLNAAYDCVRSAEKTDPVDGTGAEGLPLIPPPLASARTPKARLLRRDWIRALSAKGYTSGQIAEQLGINHEGLRKMARDMGLVIPADQAMRKTQRKAADPARAMSVVVADLDALVWSLDRIDTTDLDPADTAEWADQLRKHARAIQRMSRRILKKEQQ